jgi:release factor glutamine methyltransferase
VTAAISRRPKTLQAALEDATRRLAAAGIAEARLEARLLLGDAAALSVERLLGQPEQALEPEAAARLDRHLARRVAREPLAQILGRREFWSLPFAVTPATLVPRPESETLVEAALSLVPDRRQPLRILDLGTGAGCLLLALLSELAYSTGLGVDASLAATRLARQNAAALGLTGRAKFLVGDWGNSFADGSFDLILANPPYIPEEEIDGLAPEIARYEPRQALSGGADGLACYRALAPGLARLLRPRGQALLEVGRGQIDRVATLLAEAGLGEAGRRRDLAGIPRCLIMGRAAIGARA